MGLDFDGSFDLSELQELVKSVGPKAVRDGAQVILDRSEDLVPKRTGDLAGSARITGTETGAEIRYNSVYARWIHEHTYFKHPFGGTSKFLELALDEKADEALGKVADTIREAL